MSHTLSAILKSSVQQSLGCLSVILKKGEAHARALEVEDSVFLAARLYPNMFPLARQVQIASDISARGAARLAGVDIPEYPDTETTLAELAARAETANAYVQTLDAAALDARELETIQVPVGQDTFPMPGRQFVAGFILPNLHFHTTIAFGLLRQQGVDIGKRDFLMPGSV
ncbi:MAG: DUF1993 domain-containing protein [Pseudomonadota bacterium]